MAHCVSEVPLVWCRVTELFLLGVQYVASTCVDGYTYVATDPTRRPRVVQKLVDELANFWKECEIMAQLAFDVTRVFPTLKESLQEDRLAACLFGTTAVHQFVQTQVVHQGFILTKHVARTETVEAFDVEVEDFIQLYFVLEFKYGGLAAGQVCYVDNGGQVEHLVTESTPVIEATVKADVLVCVRRPGSCRRQLR